MTTEHTPLVTPAEKERLLHMVETLMRRSTLEPDGKIASGTNRTGRTLLFPGVNSLERSTYPAFWIRDPAWIAEATGVDAETVWGWITLMTETMQGPTPRSLASGGLIPSFSVADHINLDGSPVFYPGTYDSGESQGPPWGRYPPHDDQYWLTFTAHAYARLAGDSEAGARPVPTQLGNIPLHIACDLAHHAMAVDERTGLCIAADDPQEHQVDWGYNDTITKSGRLLFPSLLRIESCEKLAEILDGCRQPDRAARLREEARRLKAAVPEAFLLHAPPGVGHDDSPPAPGTPSERHSGPDARLWLASADGTGNLPDVWGSAFAVHRGYVPEDIAVGLARSLRDGYLAGTTVLQGQIRHIPTDFGAWPVAQSDPGTYQNGGYWGYATGWYISAVSRIDRDVAREIFVEYLEALETSWNDACEQCAWECINPELDHYQNPGYLATAAVPYAALLEAGLLP